MVRQEQFNKNGIFIELTFIILFWDFLFLYLRGKEKESPPKKKKTRFLSLAKSILIDFAQAL